MGPCWVHCCVHLSTIALIHWTVQFWTGYICTHGNFPALTSANIFYHTKACMQKYSCTHNCHNFKMYKDHFTNSLTKVKHRFFKKGIGNLMYFNKRAFRHIYKYIYIYAWGTLVYALQSHLEEICIESAQNFESGTILGFVRCVQNLFIVNLFIF